MKYLLAVLAISLSGHVYADEFEFLENEKVAAECVSDNKWCANDFGKLDETDDIYYATIHYKDDPEDYGPKLYVYKKVKSGYQLIAHSLSLNPHPRVHWVTKIENKSIYLGMQNHSNDYSRLEVFQFKKKQNQIRLVGVEDIGVGGLFVECHYSRKSINLLSSRVDHSKTFYKGAMELNDTYNEFSPNTNCKTIQTSRTQKTFQFKSPKIWVLQEFSYDYEPPNYVDFHHWYTHDKKVCGYINNKNKYDTEYCEH